LLLFGNASINSAGTLVSAQSSIVTSIPTNLLIDGQSLLKGNLGNRHKSYAHLMVSRFTQSKQVETVLSSDSFRVNPTEIDRFNSSVSEEEQNDYELSFTKEMKSDCSSDSGSESSVSSPRIDVLGKLPSKPNAFNAFKGKREVFPTRMASFHRDRADSKTSREMSVNKLKLVNCGFSPVLSFAENYDYGNVKSSNFVGGGIKTKIEACRHNAVLVEKALPKSRKLIQFWKLLAVALEVNTVEDIGSIINWSGSVLGSSLFVTLIEYLVTSCDTQTWAVTISVLGDTSSILNLCSAASTKKLPVLQKHFGILNENLPFYLENQLYLYSQWLQSWGLPVKSTEVGISLCFLFSRCITNVGYETYIF
jgi:hypothetical protein